MLLHPFVASRAESPERQAVRYTGSQMSASRWWGWSSPNSARLWARTSPRIAPNKSTRPSTAGKRRFCPDFHAAGGAARRIWPSAHAVGLPEIARLYRIGRRHAALPAAPRRWPHGGNRADAGRRARHHVHFEPGRLRGGLQVLHDRAAGPGAQPDGGRNRGPGADAGARQRARPRARAAPAQHRHDGPGRAAAQSRQRRQGHAHPARSRRLRAFAAPHHGFDRRHRSQDRRAGTRAGAAQAGDFAQRLHRRGAAAS